MINPHGDVIQFDPGNPSIKEDRVVAFSRHRALAMPELASNPPDLLQPKRSLFQKLAIFVAVLNLLEVVYWILNHQLRTVNLEIVKDLSAMLFFSLFGWNGKQRISSVAIHSDLHEVSERQDCERWGSAIERKQEVSKP